MSTITLNNLPEDLDAERSLLATICADGSHNHAMDVCSVLSVDDFVHPAHRAVFEATSHILDQDPESLSPLTLKVALDQAGKLGLVGGYEGITALLAAEEVGKPMVLAKVLREHRKRRELIRLGAQMIRQAQDVAEATESVVEGACSALAGLSQASGDRGPVHVCDVIDDVIARWVDEAEGRKTAGIKVGFPKFDQITRGFKPGQLIILAARPGVGKSTLALNFSLRAAGNTDGAIPFFTHEMTREEVVEKVLIDSAGVNPRYHSIKDPHVLDRITEAQQALSRIDLRVDDRSETTVRQIRAKVERIQARKRVGLVAIDYLQLISSPKDSTGAKQNENARIQEISRQLKLMAKDCGVPVVVLSQLNREVEKRSGGKPQLSDLRDSGAIEQDADMVIFIHRAIKSGVKAEDQDKFGELIIAKHRGGPVGCVSVAWDGELSRYTEQERETDGPVASWEAPPSRGRGVQQVIDGFAS